MKGRIAGPEIERLIQLLARLPGLGSRSARKAALALLKRRHELLEPLAAAMQEAARNLVACEVCANLDTISPCTICADQRRDRSLVVVVEEIGDLWALERAGVVNGLYHVLGGHLSPLDGIGPKEIHLDRLVARALDGIVQEVVLATNFTNEGEATAHFVGEMLATRGLKVSRIARGLPAGGELEHVDSGTLARALIERRGLQGES